MFTFKPDISAGAAGETLTRQSGNSEPVHERLYLAGRKEDLIFKMKPLQEQLDKDLTFKVRFLKLISDRLTFVIHGSANA